MESATLLGIGLLLGSGLLGDGFAHGLGQLGVHLLQPLHPGDLVAQIGDLGFHPGVDDVVLLGQEALGVAVGLQERLGRGQLLGALVAKFNDSHNKFLLVSFTGLSNASKTDAEVVAQFYNNWEELSYRARQIEYEISNDGAHRAIQLPQGDDREQIIKARVNQQFFHDAVLSSYRQQCCITGIDIPMLLIASHIKPWAVSDPQKERTNPCNGLCLNALHDRAFDKGLITVLPDYSVRVSSQISDEHGGDGIAWLKLCDHQKITMPDKFAPQREFLEYHNDVVFVP